MSSMVDAPMREIDAILGDSGDDRGGLLCRLRSLPRSQATLLAHLVRDHRAPLREHAEDVETVAC
jgi:hypothetical protein